MVLIDSSVWIAFLSAAPSPVKPLVRHLIHGRREACLTGIIFQEVLQGISRESDVSTVADHLLKIHVLHPTTHTYEHAGRLYRELRRRGITVTTIDALIAALSLHADIPLLTLDRDFERMRKICPVQLYPIGS